MMRSGKKLPEKNGTRMETDKFLNKVQPQQKTVCVCSKCCKVTLIVMAFVFLFVVIMAIVVGVLAAGPLHAQCKVQWNIGANCSYTKEALINQMKVWHTADNCQQGGQRCLYEFKNTTGEKLIGTHETPVKHYIDDLTFTFAANAQQCQLVGYSRSRVWYAIYDKGTNYCNIHNLVEGARLNETVGYDEMTSEDICTEYTNADCEKY